LTLRIPDPDFGDTILRHFGKKRGLIFPTGDFESKGIGIYAIAKKESFWKALLRPRNYKLPAGSVDYENACKEYCENRKG